MSKKVDFTDLIAGTGSPAEQDSQVVVHVRGFLNRGEVFMDTRQEKRPLRIELRKRDCIAGLRYGIVGMKVGGRRELIVGPHLGYGATGVPGKIPSNAVLSFEVELLEIRPSGTFNPEDYPLGKHLYFYSPGEAARHRPRCQFGLQEDGRCSVSLTIPVSGATWRHARHEAITKQLDAGEARMLFDNVMTIQALHPDACLSEGLWSDASEKANGITRECGTNIPCVTIGVSERQEWLAYYSLPETSALLRESKIFVLVAEMVRPFFSL